MRQDANGALRSGRSRDLQELFVWMLTALASLLGFVVKNKERDAHVDRIPVVGVTSADLR